MWVPQTSPFPSLCQFVLVYWGLELSVLWFSLFTLAWATRTQGRFFRKVILLWNFLCPSASTPAHTTTCTHSAGFCEELRLLRSVLSSFQRRLGLVSPQEKVSSFQISCDVRAGSVVERPYPAIMQSKTLSRLSTVLNSAAEINLENRAIQALPKWEPWTAFSKKNLSYLLCLFLLCLPAGWQHLKTKLQILKRGLCLPRICSSKHTLYTNPGPQEAWRRQEEMEKTSERAPKSVVQRDFPICLTGLLIQRW